MRKSASSAHDAMWYVGMPSLRSRAKSSMSAVDLGRSPVALLPRKLPHAGIEQPRALRAGLLARLYRREIAVRQPLLKDRFRHLAMQAHPLRLLVFLVPAQPQPAQALENRVERSFGVALHVGVVHAQHHGASLTARKQPVEQEGARAPDMQEAGGGRRKSYSYHVI